MKKLIELVILFVFGFIYQISAQPYLYYRSSYYDTSESKYLDYISRLNVATDLSEDFPPDMIVANYVNYAVDPSGSYLAVYINNAGSYIYSCSDTSVYYEVDDLFGAQFDEILYSQQRNKLFIFWEDWSQNLPYKLSVFDLKSSEIIQAIGISDFEDNSLIQPSRSSFFSSDQSEIYFYSSDTLTNTGQICTYSIDNNSIIQKRNLSDLGHSGSDGYDITFGRKGKGIIDSYSAYTNPNKDFYFRIYDFDKDTGSIFIYNGAPSDAYFTGNGELLYIFYVNNKQSELYNTGKVQVFSTQNGKLIKTFNLPPKGEIYTFDNYPDDIYYVVNIDSPKRQIFKITGDSVTQK
jgi:hypothetical protein